MMPKNIFGIYRRLIISRTLIRTVVVTDEAEKTGEDP